jgi:hypothetical protein
LKSKAIVSDGDKDLPAQMASSLWMTSYGSEFGEKEQEIAVVQRS